MNKLVFLFLVAIVVLIWLRFDTIRRAALKAARQHCQELGVQFLDQSVVLRSVRVARSPSGGLALIRKYSFEFSTTGEKRYQGETVFLGMRLLSMQLQAHVIH